MAERETNHAALEREVQRRVAEALASAGVPQGRISLECLFMLPPDFTIRYANLFTMALKEDAVSSGGGSTAPTRRVENKQLRDSGKGGRRHSEKTGKTTFSEKKKIGVFTGGQKRYRTHWVIRSERALTIKQSVDRRLLRLARDIQKDLDALNDPDDGGKSRTRSHVAQSSPHQTGIVCEACSAPIGNLIERVGYSPLGIPINYCPNCGTQLGGSNRG